MRRGALTFSSLLAASMFALLASSSVALAADPPKVDPNVQLHFTIGNKLYKEHKYADALDEYDEAYRLSGNYKILYNRAQCLVMLKREPAAIANFERYLKDGGSDIDADRHKEVDGAIADLKLRLGKLTLNGAPSGAIVEIDGEVVIQSYQPGQIILAGAGEHELSVRAPGGAGLPEIKQIKVLAGEAQTVDVTTLGAAPANPNPVYTPATPPPPNYGPPVGDVPYPPPATLPVHPASGLISPSFMLIAALGGSAEAGSSSSQAGSSHVLGALDVSASWRPGSFVDLGLFFAFATGRHGVGSGLGDSNTDYSYSNYGLRVRLHPIRAKSIDGWFGFDIGGFHESWKVPFVGTGGGFLGSADGNYNPTGTAFGVSVGADFPLSRTWALGGVLRYLMTTEPSATCSPGLDCSGIPGGARGYLEFGLRIVWSIPYGQKEAPVEKGSASTLPTSTFF